MLRPTVKNYLDNNQIEYAQIEHQRAFTAEEVAQTAHIPARRFCKTVIVAIDGDMVMVVLHADERINLERLRESVGAKAVHLLSEADFEDRFPDCEVGAMPPFGDLFHLPVIVSESVASESTMTFNAGTHTDLVLIPYNDFHRLVNPRVGTFASH